MATPYPSPVLSEEEDILLDSPALEVSDSESDEALLAGTEAGMWGGKIGGDTDCGSGEGLKEPKFPEYLLTPPKEVPRPMLLLGCMTLAKGTILFMPWFPLCTKPQ